MRSAEGIAIEAAQELANHTDETTDAEHFRAELARVLDDMFPGELVSLANACTYLEGELRNRLRS